MATPTRRALRAALLGAGLLAAGQALAQQKITVAWYGGNWGDAFRACVADPYTKATGVTVVPEVGTSTTTLAKLPYVIGFHWFEWFDEPAEGRKLDGENSNYGLVTINGTPFPSTLHE